MFAPLLAVWTTWATLASWFAWLIVVLCAGLFRSRAYAIFRGVMLGVYTLVALAVLPRTGPWAVPALYLHLTVYLQALRVVQITDPHLGPFMSVERLARFCERAVAEEPDLVMLTGDYLTMESQGDARWLSEALRPLEKLV